MIHKTARLSRSTARALRAATAVLETDSDTHASLRVLAGHNNTKEPSTTVRAGREKYYANASRAKATAIFKEVLAVVNLQVHRAQSYCAQQQHLPPRRS